MPLAQAGSPLNKSVVGVAAAAVNLVLTPQAGRTAYLQGFTVSAAVSASVVGGVVTVSGVNTVDGNPLNFAFSENTTTGGALTVLFPGDGIPGQNSGGAITITLPAIGSGGAGAISAYGYQV